MKFTKLARLLSLIGIFFLAACTQSKTDLSMEEALAFLEEASFSTAALENGTYSLVTVKEAPSERQEEVTEGTFQVIDDRYHWHTKWILEETSNNMRRTVTERVQQDQFQYSRMGFINQADEFIAADGSLLPATPAWQKMEEEAYDLPPHLPLLTEIQLDEADIATMEVKEEEGATVCILTYKQAYLTVQEEAALAEVEEQLEEAREDSADPSRIQSLEKSVAYQERLDLVKSVLHLTVDTSGVLTGYDLESSFEYRINDMTFGLRQKDSMNLWEYNLPDLTLETPEGLM